jgi:hypothetical protein
MTVTNLELVKKSKTLILVDAHNNHLMIYSSLTVISAQQLVYAKFVMLITYFKMGTVWNLLKIVNGIDGIWVMESYKNLQLIVKNVKTNSN